MKKAVCALVVNHGSILAVSRPGRPGDLGLPGGKVEEGETLEEAVVREVREETGLELTNIKRVFTEVCKGKKPVVAVMRRRGPACRKCPACLEGATNECMTNKGVWPQAVDYETTTFTGEVSGVVNPESGLVVAWVSEDDLVSGSFGEYNRKLFEAVLKSDR